MSKRDASELVRDLRRYFAETGRAFTVELRGGHWHVFRANGSSAGSFGSTPSDQRFRRNTVTQLRRRGVVGDDFR